MNNINLKIVEEIDKFGYGTIHYPTELKETVTTLMKSFESFCAQPLEHKMNMSYQNSMGYENRNRLTDVYSVDNKETFYIKSEYMLPKTFNHSDIDKDYILNCKKLLKEIFPIVLSSTKTLSHLANNDLSKYFDESSLTLRAIHYYPDQSTEIAYQHVDRGGQTYHLYETTDGLESYWNNRWDKIHFDHNQMAYFPGFQAQFASKCELKGLCHRVISNTQSMQHGRYSLVLFVDYHKLGYKYSFGKFGPIEKAFLPGENYEISFPELQNYFEIRK